jgi:transcriptional regulator with PAS, ATPase and Fis domain
MESFTCKQCGTTWDLYKSAASVFAFGFINLVSQDDEYIAFSCPGEKCPALISLHGPVGISNQFYAFLDAYLDPSGTESQFNKMKYFGVLPFDQKNNGLLKRLDAICIPNEPIADYQGGRVSQRGTLDTDYYCSFNENRLDVFGTEMDIWFYKKGTIETLFKLEEGANLRLIPRYMKNDRLLEDIGKYYKTYHSPASLRGEGKTGEFTSFWFDNRYKSFISQQFDYLNLLTSQPHIPEFHIEADAISNTIESEIIWKNFYSGFIREQALLHSDLFVKCLIEENSKSRFGRIDVEKLIAMFRKKICGALLSRRKKEAQIIETAKELTEQADVEAPAFKHIISMDGKIAKIKLDITRIAKNRRNTAPILLTGETGVGKTAFAKAIHKASGREGNYEGINLSNIPNHLFDANLFGSVKGAYTGSISSEEGYFQRTNGGTLLLDEFAEIDIHLQTKLLKAIEEGVIQPVGASKSTTVDVLIILGTNIDLYDAIEKGTFREDLYGRISRYSFEIPPLRERENDILLLAKHFIDNVIDKSGETSATIAISKKAAEVLRSYHWPRNIRELQNIIEGILGRRQENDFSDISAEEVIDRLPKSGKINLSSMPASRSTDGRITQSTKTSEPPIVTPAPGKRKMPNKEDIEKLLNYFFAQEGRVYGVKKKAAKYIGVETETLFNEIKRLGIVFP